MELAKLHFSQLLLDFPLSQQTCDLSSLSHLSKSHLFAILAGTTVGVSAITEAFVYDSFDFPSKVLEFLITISVVCSSTLLCS